MAKLAIVYYSSTGTNYKMAKMAEKAATDAGAEVKVVRVEELAPEAAIASNPAWKAHYDETKDSVPVASSDDLLWADAVIFSAPTRFGNVPSQMKQFMDLQGPLWAEGKLVNKVVSAMSSAQNPHGGQEATVKTIYTTMYHWGAIVAAPGYSDATIFGAGGNPYGTTATVDAEGNIVGDETALEAAIAHQTRRTLEIADKINQ